MLLGKGVNWTGVGTTDSVPLGRVVEVSLGTGVIGVGLFDTIILGVVATSLGALVMPPAVGLTDTILLGGNVAISLGAFVTLLGKSEGCSDGGREVAVGIELGLSDGETVVAPVVGVSDGGLLGGIVDVGDSVVCRTIPGVGKGVIDG